LFITGFPAGAWSTNCYVLATGPGEPCVIVDPGQDSIDRVHEIIGENRLVPAAVMLTHGHMDHVWSVAPVTRDFEVPALIHSADRYRLADPAGSSLVAAREQLLSMTKDSLELTEPSDVQLLPSEDSREAHRSRSLGSSSAFAMPPDTRKVRLSSTSRAQTIRMYCYPVTYSSRARLVEPICPEEIRRLWTSVCAASFGRWAMTPSSYPVTEGRQLSAPSAQRIRFCKPRQPVDRPNHRSGVSSRGRVHRTQGSTRILLT